MLKYPANHIRVLDQADDPHLRAASRTDQGINLPDLSPWKHIEGPVFSEKAVSDYGMKMRVKSCVISKGVNDHHKAWNSVLEAKHSTKENLKTFPGTMAKLCQKPPVVFEIDTEKNRNAEHKLPVRYRIENIVTDILSELDYFFGMTAWAEPPAFAAKCQEILIAAIGVRAPDPGEAFLQVSAFQVVMYYMVHYGTEEAVLFLTALVIVCLELFIVIVQNVP